MTVFTPDWRVKINGTTVTAITLVNLTITSGRQTIYEQPSASYCNVSLITDPSQSIPYDINDSVTIEVKKSDNTYVNLFGGFLSDIAIIVTNAGTIQARQEVRIVALGAIARLARSNFVGNLSADNDGDQMLEVLEGVLLASWNEVPGSLTWDNYEPTTQWQDAENTGLGEIDTPGDYPLAALSNLDESVYSLATQIANSGLGYFYEDSQGRIGYADSTHRAQYLAANGYVDLDARQAFGSGMTILKRAGDVRNSLSIIYGASGNQSYEQDDAASVALYGELAWVVTTHLQNLNDAEDQADFYLQIRAFPQYEMPSITYPLQNPEIDDADRDALLEVFMGQPLNIQNLPSNMTLGEYQGFVEGWTWRAGVSGLSIELTLSPIAFSLQAFRWNSVPVGETWNSISPTLEWYNATIVA
jgi:hypothetical protein